ncbi:DUF3300 domain-containing protein [Thalassotalea ganghwensis]
MKITATPLTPTKWLLIFLFIIFSSFSQAQDSEEVIFSDAELAQLLAPIALYPDTLLTHILIASTYPLEVIEAERWLSQRESLSKAEIIKQGEYKDWDASIKALLPFPLIVNRLSEDIDWMQSLGDAFLQDEAQVIAMIQTLRQQAEQAGSLAEMDNVKVIKEHKTIIIEPVKERVVYVPYYDARDVYGHWRWTHYPPVYWHRPHHYAYHRGRFYWDVGVHIGVNFFFSAFHWHNHHIVVDHHSTRRYHSSRRIAKSHHAKRWYHKPKHRKGVAYSSGHLKKKYASSRAAYSNKTIHRLNKEQTKVIKTRHHSLEKQRKFSEKLAKSSDNVYRTKGHSTYSKHKENVDKNNASRFKHKESKPNLDHFRKQRKAEKAYDKQKREFHQREKKAAGFNAKSTAKTNKEVKPKAHKPHRSQHVKPVHNKVRVEHKREKIRRE